MLPIALVFLLLALSAAPADAARRPTCFTAPGKTVALDLRFRLFVRGQSLYGCRRGERPSRLATNYDDDYVQSSSFSDPQLAGHFAGFVFTSTDISCKAMCPPDYQATQAQLVLIDLRTMARSGPGYGGGNWALTATGAMAWITSDHVVMAYQRGATRELARGPGIDPASLQASRSRVTWLQDGRVTGAGLP